MDGCPQNIFLGKQNLLTFFQNLPANLFLSLESCSLANVNAYFLVVSVPYAAPFKTPLFTRSRSFGNGRPLIALRCLLIMLVCTPLRIVNRCCSGFPVSGGIRNDVGTFNLLKLFTYLLTYLTVKGISADAITPYCQSSNKSSE